MMKTRLFSILVLVLIALGLTPIGNAFAATRTVAHAKHQNIPFTPFFNRASAQSGNEFGITIQGNIDQAETFSFSGRLFVVPTISPATSSHPFDICLDSGSQGKPIGNPETGAITLDTNSGCYPGFSTATDMGSLSYDSSTGIATFQVDPNAAALEVNVFNTSGGIAGGVEQIVGGTMQLQFANNGSGGFTVNGQINVQGNESAFSPEQSDVYTATVSGSTN